MKISEHWLREWVEMTVDINTIAERITMLGLEVDAIEPVGGAVAGVVIGEVMACGPCLLYTSPSPRDKRQSRMPSSA